MALESFVVHDEELNALVEVNDLRAERDVIVVRLACPAPMNQLGVLKQIVLSYRRPTRVVFPMSGLLVPSSSTMCA